MDLNPCAGIIIIVSPVIESKAIICNTVPFITNEIITDNLFLSVLLQGILGMDFCFLSRNAVFVWV
jgi:hypothetical protein